MSDEILEFEDEEFDAKKVAAAISGIKKLLTEILENVKSGSSGAGKEEPKYKYPEKMQAFMDGLPGSYDTIMKEKEALDSKEKDHAMQVSELEAKVKEFEKEALDSKVTEYLDFQEESGLIEKDSREALFKEYSEKFTIDQIDALMTNMRKIDFSKSKSKKGDEPGDKTSKDLMKEKEKLSTMIKDFESAGVRGPRYDEVKEELDALKEKLE